MKLTVTLILLIIGLILMEVTFARPHHPVFAWHDVPGHMALIGLIACILVSLLAKVILKPLIQRPEDHDER